MNDKSIIALAVLVLSGYIGLIFAGMAATPTPEPIPTPFDASTVDFSKFTEKDIEDTEKHRDQLKGDVKQAQEQEAQVISDQGSSIAEVKAAADYTQKRFDDYKKVAEEEITRGNQAILAAAHLTKMLHRAKWIASAIWLALCAFVALKLSGSIGMYVGGGLAIAGTAAIWMWL